MVLDDPGDSVRLVLALADRRVARTPGAAHRFRRLLHLQAVVGIVLPLLDLLVRQLAGADRVAPGQLGRRGVVGDRLHLEDMQPAEFGDLLEGERCILDQPGGGRMGHQGLGHWHSPYFQTNRAAPSGAADVGRDVNLAPPAGQGREC